MCIICENLDIYFRQQDKKELQKKIKGCYAGFSLEITDEIKNFLETEVDGKFILKVLPFFAVHHINDLYLKYGKGTDSFLKSWLHKELEHKREFITQKYYVCKGNLLLLGTYSGTPALALISETQTNAPPMQLKKSALRGDFGDVKEFSQKLKINLKPFLQLK